jgi:hypothetical protein
MEREPGSVTRTGSPCPARRYCCRDTSVNVIVREWSVAVGTPASVAAAVRHGGGVVGVVQPLGIMRTGCPGVRAGAADRCGHRRVSPSEPWCHAAASKHSWAAVSREMVEHSFRNPHVWTVNTQLAPPLFWLGVLACPALSIGAARCV